MATKTKTAAKKKTAAKTKGRPSTVPKGAVFVAKEEHWELGTRKGKKCVGDFKWWRADGTPIGTSQFDDSGKLHGVERRFHPDGSTAMASRYVHGVKWGKTRRTRSLGGGSPEDVHMASYPGHVYEIVTVYGGGELVPATALLNARGVKNPPKSHVGWLESFAREIPKYEPGTAFLSLGTIFDVAQRRLEVPIVYYAGPESRDHSVLRFAFAPPGKQSGSNGTVISIAEAQKKLVVAVDYLGRLFSHGKQPPDAGFSIEQHADGISVRKINSGGAAAAAGLRIGDVITSMNGRRLARIVDYLDARCEFAETRRLSMIVKRGSSSVTAELKA